MDYADEKYYKNRFSAKKLMTRAYSQNELEEINSLIRSYYEKQFPDVILNTNEPNYTSLADAINESHFHNKDIIKPKYLCELFNGTGTAKKKSVEKMTAILKFLRDWFARIKEKTINQVPEEKNHVIGTPISLKDWNAITNSTTPQWADFYAIPLNHGMLKRLN